MRGDVFPVTTKINPTLQKLSPLNNSPINFKTCLIITVTFNMRIIIPEKVCTLHHSIPFIDLTQKLFYLSEVGLIPIATIAALMGQCFHGS